jgi:hypothetical protein
MVCSSFQYVDMSMIIFDLEHKLHVHAEASIQWRNPTIQKLITTYNNLCGKLIDLIQQGEAPASAIAPHSISPIGIFQLDVDDDIWQDVGLDMAPPAWLADENMCTAIKFQLEVDRCNKERACIRRECCVLQEWMMAEWDALQEAHTHAGKFVQHSTAMTLIVYLEENEDLCFHFNLHARLLSGLVVHWQSQVCPIPCAWLLPDSWGPTPNDLAEAANMYVSSCCAAPVLHFTYRYDTPRLHRYKFRLCIPYICTLQYKDQQ